MSAAPSSPHLAVVLPAYNASAFLAPAIESILSQSYRNFTLWVMDDGSTDDTPALAAFYAAKDSRVRIHTLTNCGPAAARNAALELIGNSADYLMFCDADDEYLPGAFSALVSAAESGAEFVIGGFTIVNPDGSRRDYFEPRAHIPAGELGSSLAALYKANLLNQVWGKLFRVDFIAKHNLRFPDYRWGEDRLFIFRCLEECSAVEVIPACGYLYKMHTTTSLISGFYAPKPDICLLVDERVQELCRRFNVREDAWFRTMFLKSIFSCISTLYSPSCPFTRQEKRAYVRTLLEMEQLQTRLCGVAGGFFPRALSLVLRSRSVTLTLLAARLSVWLSAVTPRLFQAIKHRK